MSVAAAPHWWQSRSWQARLLYPVSLVLALVVWNRRRRARSRTGREVAQRAAGAAAGTPLIVVGNLSVGGTGKSPLVQHLVSRLQTAGHRVGIVSRGYGGAPQRAPLLVEPRSDPAEVGDEPVMHARLCQVPVCVCIDRPRAAEYLVARHGATLLIADDGLQHYPMQRSHEIVVVDGQRGFGNGWLLPAGPLREPVSRLQHVDLVAVQVSGNQLGKPTTIDCLPGGVAATGLSLPASGSFALRLTQAVNLVTGEAMAIEALPHGRVHAVTGLGNPQRFFDALRSRGFEVVEHAFADHHRFTADQLQFHDDCPILVTSKDAVKIDRLDITAPVVYDMRVSLQPDVALAAGIDALLASLPRA